VGSFTEMRQLAAGPPRAWLWICGKLAPPPSHKLHTLDGDGMRLYSVRFSDEATGRTKVVDAGQIRYADDFVIVFADESDARRVIKVLAQRFGKYGLALHPEKTRLIDYRRPHGSGKAGGGGRSLTFDFLGFTHYWGRSRKGKPVVKRKTARGRLARSLKRVALWCKRNRHKPIAEQQRYLSVVLLGHFSYYGVTGNGNALSTFRHLLAGHWHYWLRRRSQCRRLTWAGFARLRKRYPLPSPKVVHSIYRHAANPCA
jgi:RNA-directed DNA polymerase